MTVNRDPTVDIILGSAVKNMHRSKPGLVQRSGIKVSTFRNRPLHPEDITLSEFRRLAKEAGLADADIIEIVRYKQ